MGNNSQPIIMGASGLFSLSRVVLLAGLVFGLALTACSSSGPSNGSSSNSKGSSSKNSSSQQNRSPDFQRRLQAEQDAEDARDRNALIQEQNRLEQAELQQMRADRAAQRNAARAAAAQQNQQDQQNQQNQQNQ
jgi:hypothetical protein